MSRIGNKPVIIPSGVEVAVKERTITAKGPKGTLSFVVPEGIEWNLDGSTLTFSCGRSEKSVRSMFGTTRAIVANNISGVFEGYVKSMELHGQGYKVALKGKTVELYVGLSHPVYIPFDDSVKIEVKQVSNKLATIVISGCDKMMVGHYADQIRRIKPPEHYRAKGGQDENKGIRYKGEKVRTKAGKSGA